MRRIPKFVTEVLICNFDSANILTNGIHPHHSGINIEALNTKQSYIWDISLLNAISQ